MLQSFRAGVLGVLLMASPVWAQQAPGAPPPAPSAPTTTTPPATGAPANAAAQTPAGPPVTICGTPVGPPVSMPPAGSAPVIYLVAPCWEAQGNQTLVEPATYLYYIQLRGSQPTQNI